MIKVETAVHAPIDRVWEMWTSPDHIIHWNNASDDWHTPHAKNDLKPNGRFRNTMAAKDGSTSFDFEGTYTNVEPHKLIEYVIDDGRNVRITFTSGGETTSIIEEFDPETLNSEEVQKVGWQAILDNFKRYAEKAG